MRNDSLSRLFDEERWSSATTISPLSAKALWKNEAEKYKQRGTTVAEKYGLLAHYTTWLGFARISKMGAIGGIKGEEGIEGEGGCFLSPTAYAGCMSPYNVGLSSPRDICLLVDVGSLDELWGPGTAEGSKVYPWIWRGGAIEFYCPVPVPVACVKRVAKLAPCGDLHQ